MKFVALLPAAAMLAATTQDSPVMLQPGQWTFTTQLDDIELPGQPAQVVDELRRTVTRSFSVDRCMTPEEARDPMRSIATDGGAQDCTYAKRLFEDGRIDVETTCPAPAGGTARFKLAGTFAPTRLEAGIEGESDQPTALRWHGRMTGQRTGECRPSS